MPEAHDHPASTFISEAKMLRLSRRSILRRGAILGLSAPVINAALAATGHAAPATQRHAPALLQGTSLNMLISTAFVPAAQEFFAQQAQTFGQENNVSVTTDFINWPDLQPRTTSAVQAGSGPDIIELWDAIPPLFKDSLVDVNDLATKVGDEQGGYYEWATKTAAIDGHWYSVPHGTSTSAVAYRASYLEQGGIKDAANNPPKTWEEFFAAAKATKAATGKPFGQSLGQSLGDPPSFCYPYMWAYGAMEVEEDGKTVAINKPEFVAALETFIQAWKDGFDETGLGWDDSTNNAAYLSDQISATLNGSSIYLAAADPEGENANAEIAADTYHASLPEGPAGRFNVLGSRSMGIMSYSQNQEGAKAFLEWWFSPEQFLAWLQSFKGYILPPAPKYVTDPVFTADPKLAAYAEVVTFGRNKGYAGPSNQKAAQVAANYVIVNCFAETIRDGDAQAAVDNAERLLQRFYGS